MEKLYQHEKRVSLRVSKECYAEAKKLKDMFPDDYKSINDVFRSGVYALKRWKRNREVIYDTRWIR